MATNPLVLTQGLNYRRGLLLTVRSRQVGPNLQAEGGRFIRGAQSAARYAHDRMALMMGEQMRQILNTEVVARRARFPGQDFNAARANRAGTSLRASLTYSDMWQAGAFGFSYSTRYLDTNPRTAPYWRRVNDGVTGQTFPLVVTGNRARTATSKTLRKAERGRGRVIIASYSAPGYRFLERGAEKAEAILRSGTGHPASATSIYKDEFAKAGIPFDARRRGNLPRGIGVSPRTGFTRFL